MNEPPANRGETRYPLSLTPGRTADAGPDTPGLVPVCPRCHLLLKGGKHATGIAWRCEGCGGESLNFSQFRRLIPELQANEIWMTAMEHPVAPRRRARCPECRRDMAAVLVPFQGRHIELDICRTCQRLWMDHQEQRSYRLDLDDQGPGPQPPVIKMTGRGVARAMAERLRKPVGTSPMSVMRWMYFLFLMGALLMLLVRHWTGR